MNSDHSIGSAIRAARKYDKLGLRELARQASISPGYLSRLETGDAPSASEDALLAIARALSRPLAPLVALAGGDFGLLPLEAPMPHLVIPNWAREDSERLASGELDQALLRRFAHDFFVHSRLGDIIDAFGFADDLAPLQSALASAGPQRALTILAFAEEQAVLAALDRKGSNPASRRLVGHLYRPEDQRRLDAIMAKVNPAIDA